MAEHLTITWTHERRVSPGQLSPAIYNYQQSKNCATLMREVEAAFQQFEQVQVRQSRATIHWQRVVHTVYVSFQVIAGKCLDYRITRMKNPAQDVLAANLFKIALRNRLGLFQLHYLRFECETYCSQIGLIYRTSHRTMKDHPILPFYNQSLLYFTV